MSHTRIINLTVSLNGSKFYLDRLDVQQAQAPRGVADPSEPVATGIIGYWVDIMDNRQQTLYRRFINHGLPLNPDFTCRDWSALRRRKFRFSIQLPALANAHSVVLFEQYQPSPSDKRIQRRRHINAFVEQTRIQELAG
jgi:hypothetical protein